VAEAEHVVKALLLAAVSMLVGGVGVAVVLRRSQLRWTWALLGLPVAFEALGGDVFVPFALAGSSLLAAGLGAVWHRSDLHTGVDFAEAAHRRVGPRHILARMNAARRVDPRRSTHARHRSEGVAGVDPGRWRVGV